MDHRDHRETLTTLPVPTQFCCARHTLSPETIGTGECGPFTDEDLGRMLVKLQTAISAYDPLIPVPSGAPERVLLAVLPELLKLRASELPSVTRMFPLHVGQSAGEIANWLDKMRAHGTGGDVTIDGVVMDTTTCRAILQEAAAALRSRVPGFTLSSDWEKAGEFRSHAEWVNKAASWTRGYERRTFMHDAKGRICSEGADFVRARDENAFPVTYYLRTKP